MHIAKKFNVNNLQKSDTILVMIDKFKSTSFLAILACLFWSTAFVSIKIGLQYAKPFSFAGMRFMLSGLILLPFWWKHRPGLSDLICSVRTIILVALIQTFFLYFFFYWGIMYVSGAVTAILIGSQPLITAVVTHFTMRDERLNLQKTLILMLGFAGIIIISLANNSILIDGAAYSSGIILLLLSCLTSAFGNIAVAKHKVSINPVCLNSFQLFLGGSFLFLISIPLEGLPKFDYPLIFYPVLFWLALLSSIAFSIWFVLLRREGVKVSSLNVWKFIIPVNGALLSWLFLPGEHPSLKAVTGMVLIAISIIFYYHLKK